MPFETTCDNRRLLELKHNHLCSRPRIGPVVVPIVLYRGGWLVSNRSGPRIGEVRKHHQTEHQSAQRNHSPCVVDSPSVCKPRRTRKNKTQTERSDGSDGGFGFQTWGFEEVAEGGCFLLDRR